PSEPNPRRRHARTLQEHPRHLLVRRRAGLLGVLLLARARPGTTAGGPADRSGRGGAGTRRRGRHGGVGGFGLLCCGGGRGRGPAPPPGPPPPPLLRAPRPRPPGAAPARVPPPPPAVVGGRSCGGGRAGVTAAASSTTSITRRRKLGRGRRVGRTALIPRRGARALFPRVPRPGAPGPRPTGVNEREIQG